MDQLQEVISRRSSRLFIYLAGFFVANALVAELIGVKIFALEDTLGLPPWNFNLFGEVGALQFSAGVLLWPVVFVITDLLNEYYGERGVRLLSYFTVVLIGYAFIMIFLAIQLEPAEWWRAGAQGQGVPDYQSAFRVTFGQGLFIIVGSLTAFLVAQLTDVFVFHRIREKTGNDRLWLRATGSTLVSQLVDSFIVLYIAFKLGPSLIGSVTEPWPWSRLLAVATVQYLFKFTMAVLLTPVIYWGHALMDRYLGIDRTERTSSPDTP